ncbi:MAG: alpha-galactosidase, partial [Bacteroidetes bacterium]
TVLPPGQTTGSDRFMISIGPDPYRALEAYADAMALTGEARTGEVVNGWCNWFYTLNRFGEDEILQNAAFAASHLGPYGLEYIQIDEGFQAWHGDWHGNSDFPHGLKWLATRIRQMGLKPGIWISPFVVSDTTVVFRDHPEWFLKNAEGGLLRVGPWPDENTGWFRDEAPKRYGLDITHPGAEKWFTDLIDTIVNNWGFEMIKVDFVAWSVFSAHHFYDRSATPAQVYSRALRIIRETAGNSCHLLDCGPGNITIGSINSMRIEYDQNYGYADQVWKQYFLGPSSSAGAAGKRYFYHNRAWTNDADHVCIDLLPGIQAQAAATIISLSGGNMMSGDRLTYLDDTKLEILKKVFPSSGISARPIDLFDTDPQLSFAAGVRNDFDGWTVAGFFNPGPDEPVRREFALERLWLDPDKKYLVYDFWNERFMGEITDSISVVIQPGSVLLLSIHEKKGIPQFISTTRHTMQGMFELEDVRFDPANNALSGISTGPAGSSHDVIVYLPGDYSWSPETAILYEDHLHYSIKMVDPRVIRVRLQFDDTE